MSILNDFLQIQWGKKINIPSPKIGKSSKGISKLPTAELGKNDFHIFK